MLDSDKERLIEKIAEWIISSQRIIIFTGAGISTESGIPDFRGPGGLWEKYDPNDFLYQKFLTSPESRKKYWQMHTELYYILLKTEPNPAHYACVELEKMGKLECLITQNIDNLHQKAGTSPHKIIELHGNALKVICLNCEKNFSRKEIQGKIEAGEIVPQCEVCNGILKPATVAFGQPMPQWEVSEAERHSLKAELFIVIGSSLVVHPAALMPLYAKRGGAKLVIINLEPTPYDHEAEVVIRGRAGDITTQILEQVKEKLAEQPS